MSPTLILVIACIIILFLLFILLYLVRERVEIKLEEDVLLLNYSSSKKRIVLDQELVSWKLQQAQYIRWGNVYSINMLLKNGRRIGLNSRFNQDKFELLYDYLSKRYNDRREPDD